MHRLLRGAILIHPWLPTERVTNMFDPEELLATAVEAVTVSGELLRQSWNGPRQISHKGHHDWVTQADIASQRAITSLIRKRFPTHGFLTEEDDASLPTEGPVLWIVDPVDGTSNYSRKIPNFSISVAAASIVGEGITADAERGAQYRPVVGVICDPLRNEIFSAAVGHGATLNGEPLHVSATASLGQAILAVDWSRQDQKRQLLLSALGDLVTRFHTVRAMGSAALALAWVGAGRLDIYYNLGVGSWDVAAGQVIIAEAGGMVTNLDNEPWALTDIGCLASNGQLQGLFLRAFGQ